MNSNTIVIIVVPILMFLFSLIAPNAKTVALEVDINTLKKKYKKWDIYSLIIFFVLTPILGFIFGSIIKGIILLSTSTPPVMGFRLLSDPDSSYFVGGILALGWVSYVGGFIYKKILREDYEEYINYANLSSGFDGTRLVRPLAYCSEIIALIMLVFLTDYSIEINKKDIVFDDFAGFEDRKYTYKQVKSISYVLKDKNGTTLIDRPHHFIKFDDNTNWNTVYRFLDIGTDGQEQQIINYISAQSRVKIDMLLTDP